MAGKYTGLVNKLIKSILKNYKRVLLLETQQFYSTQQDRIITLWVLSERITNTETGRNEKVQILKTPSQVELVKFLGSFHKELQEKL